MAIEWKFPDGMSSITFRWIVASRASSPQQIAERSNIHFHLVRLDKHPPSRRPFAFIHHFHDTSDAIAMSVGGDIHGEYCVFPYTTYDVVECQRQGSFTTIDVGRDGILDYAGNVWANVVCKLAMTDDAKLRHQHSRHY